MKSQSTIFNKLILIIGIIVLLNYIAGKYFFRLDLTADNRYTLSKVTKDILKSLDQPVTVIAYFTEKLPPDQSNLRRDFKNMLKEYESISKGMVVYKFEDPEKDSLAELEVAQKGIQKKQLQDISKDELNVKQVYMAAEVQVGNESEIIDEIASSNRNDENSVIGMEYFLTSAIKKLITPDKPKVGILSGHGEQDLSIIISNQNVLKVDYTLEEVTLTDSTDELSDIKVLVIVNPTDSFPEHHLQQLSNFVAEGKSIFIAMNRADIDLSKEQFGQIINTGLESWLSEKGIVVNENFVMDINCRQVGIPRQQRTPFGIMTVQQPIDFPIIPEIEKYPDHPITSGLNPSVFVFASSISFTGDSSIKFMPILQTSEHSGTHPATSHVGQLVKEEGWTEDDLPLPPQTFGAAIEGSLVKNEAKMVVIGDGDFLRISQGFQGTSIENLNLITNAIDWLADNSGLIDLRTKGRKINLINSDIKDSKRTFLKYFNFLLPIIIAVIIGIIRMEIRRNKRIKRMEEGYV